MACAAAGCDSSCGRRAAPLISRAGANVVISPNMTEAGMMGATTTASINPGTLADNEAIHPRGKPGFELATVHAAGDVGLEF